MSDDDKPPALFAKWVSFGDVIVLLSTLSVFAFGYGQLSRDVASLTRAMEELQARDITPGARSSISALVAKDVAQDQQITEIRLEVRAQRQEILDGVRRIEDKLDDHMVK